MPYVAHWKLFLDYLMTPRVLKVLCIFHLDSVFHMGQDCLIVSEKFYAKSESTPGWRKLRSPCRCTGNDNG